MTSAPNAPEQANRKFPRRPLKRNIGVLCGGDYIICEGGELGEGGMSILSEFALSNGQEVVVNFQIPSGNFISLRAQVVSAQKKMGDQLITHGLSFLQVDFSVKRQIRQFVSARKDFVLHSHHSKAK